MEKYFLREGAAIDPPRDGWFPVTYAITRDARLARTISPNNVRALWRAWYEARRNHFPEAIEPFILPDTAAAIEVLEGGGVDQGPSFALEELFPLFDQLTDGSWIVTNRRCSVGEENARLLEPDGTLRRRFCVGDGISHLQCDGESRIWIGYFDEGVFGLVPIGASGLNCFDNQGRIEWRYEAPIAQDTDLRATEAVDRGRLDVTEQLAKPTTPIFRPETQIYVHVVGQRAIPKPPIARSTTQTYVDIYDCYAMNVAADAVWCCPYSSVTFPIIRVGADKGIRVWRNTVSGARAIAASRQHVLLVGGYGENASRGVLLRLDDENATPIREITINFPDGTGLVRGTTMVARDDVVHFVYDNHWFRLSVTDLV